MRPRWEKGPAELVLVRHGHSVANEADARARESGAEAIELDGRDADTELSATGREQAEALGRWLARQEPGRLPTVAVASPYRRADDTAQIALGGLDDPPVLDRDERLRERDLGALDGLTGTGIRARHPEEATRRERLGKFYYQPPSGESWADVALRVRSFLADLQAYDGERVWLFTHQAVVMAFRYVLDDLSEREVLDLDRQVNIPNASLTTFRRDGDALVLEAFADTSHLDQDDTDVTHEKDKVQRS